MELKKAIEKLENSEEFKEKHGNYLAHAFCIIKKVQADWQI